MLTEYERQLDDAERARLLASVQHRFAPPAGVTLAEILGVPSISPLGAVALMLPSFIIVAVFWSPLIAGITAVVYILLKCLPAYIIGKRRRRIAKAANDQKFDDLKNAVLDARTERVQRIESDRVAKFINGDVLFHLFDLGDGRTFWHGLLDDDSFDDKQWPNSLFEMIQVSGCDHEFGPFCQGLRLQPVEPVECLDHVDLNLPETGIINRPLDEFLRDAAMQTTNHQ